jgi:catechol 2,3-dioxygenase-like lactoylglutathione lyase family enzyme
MLMLQDFGNYNNEIIWEWNKGEIYPKVINHIGVSVSNVDDAVCWYRDKLGFNVIRGPIDISDGCCSTGKVFSRLFGQRFKKARAAWLSSGNQVGLELIEFIDPKAEERSDSSEYWKTGFSHICITDPNIEELCKIICNSGGEKLGEIQTVDEKKSRRLVYCKDPFDNITEIFTHSYEQFNANQIETPSHV